MKGNSQSDAAHCVPEEAALIDPEAYDASEQQFAASLEEKSGQPAPRFILEYEESPDSLLETSDASPVVNQKDATQAEGRDSKEVQQVPAIMLESPGQPPQPDSWRREVAARVNHYRGKRPRVPRYPSLQLRFESPEPTMIAQPASSQTREIATCGQLAITMDPEPAPAIEIPAEQPSAAPPDGATKILEFPRSSFMPPVVVDELAEPVFHHPRILEVPEVLPPPPALGGISIEPSEELKDERRPGFETPLKPTRLTRRILAGMTDALVVVTSFAAFAYIFFRITSFVPPLRQGMEVAGALLAGSWAAYQYLLLMRAGSTPGLKLAKLELSRFDGRPVPRGLRRWRVLASVLSGLSLGLGYAWCFLDEDELCWHDRITHTYMAPKAAKSLPVTDKLQPNVLDF